MKRITILILFLLTVLLTQAQNSVGVYAAYGRSAFDDDFFGFDVDPAGYIPIGVQITLGKGNFQFGVDAHYSVVPFTWEVEAGGRKLGEIKITQLFGGAFARFNIKLANEKLVPFIRGGVGAYMGELKGEDESSSEEESEDFKTAIGFFISPGIDLKVGPNGILFVEVPLHFVQRELDIEGSEAKAANSYSIAVGYRILFR